MKSNLWLCKCFYHCLSLYMNCGVTSNVWNMDICCKNITGHTQIPRKSCSKKDSAIMERTLWMEACMFLGMTCKCLRENCLLKFFFWWTLLLLLHCCACLAACCMKSTVWVSWYLCGLMLARIKAVMSIMLNNLLHNNYCMQSIAWVT